MRFSNIRAHMCTYVLEVVINDVLRCTHRHVRASTLHNCISATESPACICFADAANEHS